MTRWLQAGEVLLLASHNAGKLAEFRALLAPTGIILRGAGDFGLSAPEETGDSYAANAGLKARWAAARTGFPALADDSGLEVAALRGAPGVRSADWATRDAVRDDAAGLARICAAVSQAGAEFPTPARFVSALCLCLPDGRERFAEGVVDGQLVWPPRGDAGHGYDPIFAPQGSALTYGQLAESGKSATSHRARAVTSLIAECFT